MIELKNERYSIIIEDKSDFRSSRLVEMPAVYRHKYSLGDPNVVPLMYGIYYGKSVNKLNYGNYDETCLIEAGGAPTALGPNSALIHENHCVLVISSFVVSLRLPDLKCEWYAKADSGSCFGIYHSLSSDSYIVHGELEVTRVAYSGEILWASSGKDIFTGGFALNDDYVEVIDFNNEKYHIDFLTGYSRTIDS